MQTYLWDPTFRGKWWQRWLWAARPKNAVLGLAHCLRRRTNISLALAQSSILAELLVWTRLEDGTVILCYTRRSLPVRRPRIYNIETARDKERESSERDARTTVEKGLTICLWACYDHDVIALLKRWEDDPDHDTQHKSLLSTSPL